METKEHVDIALATLEQASLGQEEPPAVIRLVPPNNSAYLSGNRDGYIQLAIASLRAALGEDQSFKHVDWVSEEDLDWGLLGLKYDSSAHIFLPPPRTRVGRVRDVLFLLISAIVGIAVFGIFSVGVIEIISWFKRQF